MLGGWLGTHLLHGHHSIPIHRRGRCSRFSFITALAHTFKSVNWTGVCMQFVYLLLLFDGFVHKKASEGWVNIFSVPQLLFYECTAVHIFVNYLLMLLVWKFPLFYGKVMATRHNMSACYICDCICLLHK